MKKYLPYIIFVFLILLVVGGGILWKKARDKKNETSTITPPSVKRVNDLELSKRPYVALLPHPNPGRCMGVDMVIEQLKMEEQEAEYEVEYSAGSLIQGVFGRRSFLDKNAVHQPLEFGSCSKGKCKCDQDISGGSITLDFSGAEEEYTLKSDFTLQAVSENKGKLTSVDARLQIDVGSALPGSTQVIIMKTMGLPAGLEGLPADSAGELLAGPYGVFAPKGDNAKTPMEFVLQTKDTGKVMFWNGAKWQEIETEASEGKITGRFPNVGVIALVK